MNCKFYFSNLKWELLFTKKKYFRPSRREINKDEVLQGKFVAWPFHFPSKPQMSTLSASTFHLYISSLHFWPFKKGDFLNLTEPYHGSFSLACTNGQMVDVQLTNQKSERGLFLLCYKSHLMMNPGHVFRRLISFLAIVVKTGRFVCGKCLFWQN